MFTGLIQDIGIITAIDRSGGDARFTFQTSLPMDNVAIGASIACAGCCLTVLEKGDNWFTADLSAETLSKTRFGNAEVGDKINLEPSLKLGDELGGHLVSGHIDGLARLIDIQKDGDSHRLKIEVPQEFSHFIASKGSVALDGISLTVNEVEGHIFGVNIIAHTWAVTTLGHSKIGDSLHLEVDIMARYAARLMAGKNGMAA